MTAARYVMKLAVDGVAMDELRADSLELVGLQLRTRTRAIAAREEDNAPVWNWIEAGHQHVLDQLAEGHSVTVEFELQSTAQTVAWQLSPVLQGTVTGPLDETVRQEGLPAAAEERSTAVEPAWPRQVPGRIVKQVQNGLNGAETVRRALDDSSDGNSGHYEVNMRPTFTIEADSLGELFRRAAAWADCDPRMIPMTLGYSRLIDDVDDTDQWVHTLEVAYRYPGD